jgi:hypothetical protein
MLIFITCLQPATGRYNGQEQCCLRAQKGFTFENNHVTRCDGNGLKVSNYNRNVSILSNEFSWIGDNAISQFGSMSNCLYQNCSVKLPYASGLDGQAGNQPRYTRVVGNVVREVGLWQKQSGAFVSHLSARSYFEVRLCFLPPSVGYVNTNIRTDPTVGPSLFCFSARFYVKVVWNHHPSLAPV